MQKNDARKQWEGAAPGWAKWEATVASWVEPATTAMLTLADIGPGARVLDLACGAGSQTLSAARRVGAKGHVVASDISDTMLQHVRDNARAAGLDNVSPLAGAAEDLDLGGQAFDAVICRLGLMLFAESGKALAAARAALRPGGKIAVVVFTAPTSNAFMAKPMQILLRHAGKTPPPAGKPGIFSLGAPGVLERLFTEGGYADVEQRTMTVPLRMASAAQALEMMREAFGAYRAVVSDQPESVQTAAWAEVVQMLKGMESATGFEASAELLVAAATRPA